MLSFNLEPLSISTFILALSFAHFGWMIFKSKILTNAVGILVQKICPSHVSKNDSPQVAQFSVRKWSVSKVPYPRNWRRRKLNITLLISEAVAYIICFLWVFHSLSLITNYRVRNQGTRTKSCSCYSIIYRLKVTFVLLSVWQFFFELN